MISSVESPSPAPEGLAFVDLFSGPGGLSMGFEQAGFSPVLIAEADANARKTYLGNRKEPVAVFTDVRDVNYESVLATMLGNTSPISLVIGGPPCQGFSLANTRYRGSDNERSLLSWQFPRVVAELRPYAFLMENVLGLKRLESGRVLRKLIRRFEGNGYIARLLQLRASDYGVPQHRDRIFIIGFRAEHGLAWLSRIDDYLLKSRRQPVSVSEALDDLPDIGDGGGQHVGPYGVEPRTPYQRLMRAGRKAAHTEVLNHRSSTSNEFVLKRMRRVPPGGNWESIPVDVLRANGGYKVIGLTHSHIYKRLHPEEPSVTIANFRKAMLTHHRENRLLSVREAARLQSFPDRYTFFGSLGQQQQQVADAVPPMLANVLARFIKGELARRVLEHGAQFA